MPMVDADWTITRTNGNIRYTGDDHGGASPSYATAIEFRRWLGEWADDAEFTGDEEYDIIDQTAADRKTDNFIQLLGIFNIDATAAEHIYDGSIIQGTGGTEEFYDAIVNFGNADVQIQIIQDGAVLADDWWNEAGAGLNPDLTQGISHRFLILTRTAGADVDGRRLIGTCRRFNETYDEFSINGTARGNNVLALSDADDINNNTAVGTVATWTGITLTTEGYVGIDANNDGGDEFYYSEWNTNQPTRTITEFYERMKWATRDGSTETLWGLNGELFRGITHEWDVDGQGATDFSAFEEITWATGTAQMFAVDDVNAASKVWIQLLTGTIPADNITFTGTTSGATADTEFTGGASTPRPISLPMCGVATGQALLGAYGFGIEAADLAVNDRVTDLGNNVITPPNNVSFDVIGVVSTEDQIIVTNNNAGDIDFGQFTLNGALTGVTTSVVVNGAIPSDTPSSGTIRIERNDGLYSRHPYSAFTGSTFTITSHDFTTNNASNGNNTFISYLDLEATATTESFTVPYSSDRTLFGRVRDGKGTPIKTFESTAVLGINGGSMVVQRVSDE